MTDDWIRDAMSQDALVAEVLLQLRRAVPPPSGCGGESAPKLEWSVRQRRTKAVAAATRKKGDQARASPTTPLSWSGATSVSGGGTAVTAAGDGVEESSGAVKPPDTVRSKISQTSGTTAFKRSKRKKTLAELKEEENLLLNERKSLKNELASFRALLEEQRARNVALKKLKAESRFEAISPAASSSPLVSSKTEESEVKKDPSFLLPDLNIPLDNNPSPETS